MAVLYFARAVLIPLALAILVAFMLGPLVIRLRHWGLGKVPAALIVVLLAFATVGVLSSVMASQTTDVARKLPQYRQNVRTKLDSVRNSGGGLLARLSKTVHSVTDGLTPPAPPPENRNAEERPVPVEIRRSPFSPFEVAQKLVGSVLEVVVTAGIVTVFVVFILIEREDLRDRMIRLAGSRRVNLTTTVLDDAAQRVSRYLLAQLVVNLGFGLLAGVGLYFMGVPNPFLWGMLAALFRYVPYLGIWVAALLPAAMAFAVEPGWVKVPLVFALYFGIDLFMYNLAEPLLYGSSTGVSPLAILVAAVFWTWLWGPVGLLLATPLTVCVVVIGHHVPSFSFLRVLLSDEPVLTAETRFYQRMLAMDLEDATEVALEFLKGKSLEELYDSVIIPALTLAESDRHQGKLDDVRQQFIFQNTRILLEDIAEREADLKEKEAKAEVPVTPKLELPPGVGKVLCIPARDEADALASLMLTQVLAKRGIACIPLSSGVLASESLNAVEREHPVVAAVLAVPPFGYMHARYICRRLQSGFPELKVVGAILTEQDAAELKQRQPALQADALSSSLKQTVAHIISLISVRAAPATAAA